MTLIEGDSIERLVAFLVDQDFDFWHVPVAYEVKGKSHANSRSQTQARLETIKRLAQEGSTYIEIGAQLNVKAQSVRQTVSDYNLSHPQTPINVVSARRLGSLRVVQRDILLYESFLRGNSYSEMASEYGICKALVSRIVKKMGATDPQGTLLKKEKLPDDDWNF